MSRQELKGTRNEDWGMYVVICPECEEELEVNPNSVKWNRLPKDQEGRAILTCKRCKR